MQLRELKKQFLEYLEVERGRGAKTVENYDRCLERFFSFTQVKIPQNITEDKVCQFRLYLSKQAGTKVGQHIEPLQQRTQNYYLIAVRAFLKFLRNRGITSMAPESIILTKVPARLPDLLPPLLLERLLSAPKHATPEGKRDRAILELLSSTGLRVSELCGLNTHDVDLARDELSIRGKGDKERVVFLSATAKKALKEYLLGRNDKREALFIRYGKKAHVGDEARVSPRTVQRLVQRYAVQAGIVCVVTPQVIRNSFAAALVSHGANLQSVQTLLGHAHISTTQIYARSTALSSQAADTRSLVTKRPTKKTR